MSFTYVDLTDVDVKTKHFDKTDYGEEVAICVECATIVEGEHIEITCGCVNGVPEPKEHYHIECWGDHTTQLEKFAMEMERMIKDLQKKEILKENPYNLQ
jgi:hypothetical protein